MVDPPLEVGKLIIDMYVVAVAMYYLWMCIVNSKRFSFSWVLNLIINILGVLLMVVVSIAFLQAIIDDASSLEFYV